MFVKSCLCREFKIIRERGTIKTRFLLRGLKISYTSGRETKSFSSVANDKSKLKGVQFRIERKLNLQLSIIVLRFVERILFLEIIKDFQNY